MGKFIPIDKMKKLREAARGGDERAKKIIAMQLGGKDDFSNDLDDYFKPQPTMDTQASGVQQGLATSTPKDSNPKLMSFLKENGVEEGSADYQGFVDDFYKEFPNEKPMMEHHEEHHHEHEDGCVFDRLIKDEIEAITSYQQALLEIINDDSIGEAAKKGIIADLEEIKRDEMEHLDKLKRLKSSKDKKEEQAINPGQLMLKM